MSNHVMPADDLVLEAMRYRRHVGADAASIQAYLMGRIAAMPTFQDVEAALNRLVEAEQIRRLGQHWFLTPEAYRCARGAALAPTWKAEDAWILLSLWSSRNNNPHQLEQIIAVADFINHAIPTLEELHGALNRLAAGHLIKSQSAGFSLTPRGLALCARLPPDFNKSVMQQGDGLKRLLQCPCCGVSLKAVRWGIQLDANSYNDAVKAYLKLAYLKTSGNTQP